MKLLNEFLESLTTFKVVHLIIFVGLITFANSLFNPFTWDDTAYILNNPATQTLNIFSFFGNNIFNNAGQYRPLTLAYFALLHTSFGNLQFFYHFTQIILHIVNTCLLFILFKSFFDKRVAFFLGLVFLVHPMQVESVSYISASGGALSFFFGLTAFLVIKISKKTPLQNFLPYILILFSALTKETGLLFFPLIIFYQFILNKNILKKNIISSTISVGVYFLIRSGIGNIHFADRPLIPIARLNLTERLINIPQVIFYYIKTFFFPSSLAIDQQWTITKVTFTDFYLPLLLDILFLSVLISLGIFLYKKQRKNLNAYLFFCLWFLMGLTLHSQIIPLDMTVADRWFYFDMAGLLGIIGLAIQNFPFTIRNYGKTFITILGIIVIAALMTRTMIRNYDWSDHTKLYTHDIAVRDNFLIQEEFALDLVGDGKLEEALIPAKKSIEYFPHEENFYNLGYIYERLGNIPQAKESYIKALNAKNYTTGEKYHNVTIYIRLANILLYYDDPNVAKQFITDALKYYPNADRLWLLLGLSEYKLQNHDEALKAAEHAYNLLPNSQTNYNVYMKLVNNQPIDIIFKY